MFLGRFRLRAFSSPIELRQNMSCHASTSASSSMRVAVVGDVHDQWSPRDAACLKALDADFHLFVGDFGNEKVPLVKQIASLPADTPKAVILGNHDAWYTMTARGRGRSRSPPAARAPLTAAAAGATTGEGPSGKLVAPEPEPDRVQLQLDALGDCHVGYRHLALPGSSISLVGARPFSKGGKSLRSMREFMARFGVLDMKDSADKILDVINTQVPASHALIILGHNGPAGLGSQRHNICGCDWLAEAGDHGDPDLQEVLQQLPQAGRAPSLVVFGHMHHQLQGGGRRQMVHVDQQTGTVFLNAATVPRVQMQPMRGPGPRADSKHHFLVVDLVDGRVAAAANVWVLAKDRPAAPAGPPSVIEQDDPSAAVKPRGADNGAVLQEILLHQGQRISGEHVVQVADVFPVFRTLDQEKSHHHQQQQQQLPEQHWQNKVREGVHNGNSSSKNAYLSHVEYFDAFAGSWRSAALPHPLHIGTAADVAAAAAAAAVL